MEQNTPNLQNRIRVRGIYLLPNLFTTGSLFFAFYALIAGLKGQFAHAASAILIAMIIDTLDGRVARLTNTQTTFGAEYDSLADMVSFGVVPAFLVYLFALAPLGKLGWLVAFTYTACTALRLARFNSQAQNMIKRYFVGLPCPLPAGVLCSLIWMLSRYHLVSLTFFPCVLIAILTLLLSLFMVSSFRYYSFKQIDFRDKVPFATLLILLILIVGIALHPPIVLFVSFLLYAFSGPTQAIWRRMRKASLPH